MIGFGQGWKLLLDHPYYDTDEKAYSFVEDNDGYLILATKTGYPYPNLSDIWLVKVDFNGDTIYTKSIDITNNDIGYSIKKTTDGGYIIGATVESQFITGAVHFNESFCLIKLNSFGDTSWVKYYNYPFTSTPSNSTIDICYSVIQTSDGGYMMTGKGGISPIGSSGPLLIKTDQYGDIIWSKLYDDASSMGGGMSDLGLPSYPNYYTGTSIIETTDSNFVMLVTANYTNGNPISALVKINSIGDTLWVKSFPYYSNPISSKIVNTGDGGYVLSGEKYNVFTGDFELYYFKTNFNGDIIWEEYHFNGMSNYNNNNTQYDNFNLNSPHKTIDDGFIFCSSDYEITFPSDSRLCWNILKTDSSGNVIFSNKITLPNPVYQQNEPVCIKQTSDEGYLMLGSNRAIPPDFDTDLLIIKIDSLGNVTNTIEIPISSGQRKLKKVTDLLGRETKQTNQPLFYIYDDGTVEKRIVIE